MNGRVYHPGLGRFISADPFVQFPKASQSLNRYGYVLNNPLSYTDPSGFGIFGELLDFHHTIDPIQRNLDNILAKSTTLQSIGGVAAGVASVYFGPWVAAAYSAHLTNIQGGSTGDIMKAGAIAGAAAYASGAAGGLNPYAAFAANIAIGTAAGVASGADFDDSFYASAITAAASAATAGATQNAHPAVGYTISAAIGGTASELSGGKFINGAVSGAFAYGLTRSLEDQSTDDPLESDFAAAEMQEVTETSPYAAGGESIEIAQNSITRKFEIGIGGGVGRGGGGGRPSTGFVGSSKGVIDVRPTIDRIIKGERLPYRNDGSTFRNDEGLLPARPSGYYREYVHPTPGVNGPGTYRIIQGQDGGFYLSPDHYRTFIPLK